MYTVEREGEITSNKSQVCFDLTEKQIIVKYILLNIRFDLVRLIKLNYAKDKLVISRVRYNNCLGEK